MIHLILILLAGMCAGLSDRAKFHPLTLPMFLQHRDWWNTGIVPSWKLKYKNNDPAQGEKFWLSTSLLVMFTDAHHFFKFAAITLALFGMNGAVFYLPVQYLYLHWLLGLIIYKLGFIIIYK